MHSSLTVSRRPQLPSPPLFRQWPAGPQWLWVTGPTGGSAVNYGGFTFICGLNLDGGIRVMQINNATGAVVVSPQILNMGVVDAHATPTLVVRGDGRLVLAVSPHAAAHLWVAISTNALDVSAWGAATDIAASISAVSVTYCYLIQLANGTTYLFYREGNSNSDQLYVTTSSDGGVTWSARGKVFDPSGHGAYWSLDSDDTTRIDLIAGDGSATVGVGAFATASVYHAYFDVAGGAWHKSDGTLIRSGLAASLVPSDMTKIFDGATLGGLDQPQFAITAGGTPLAGWSALDPSDPTNNNAKYWAARYSGGAWIVSSPADIGCPPSGGTGGFAIDPVDPRYAFASRKQPDGTFQVELYKTLDNGATWSFVQKVTDDGATRQVATGLIAPRRASPAIRCVWLAGDYPKSINSIDSNAFNLRSAPNLVGAF